MLQATFWFANPFREWIGQRTLTLAWEGKLTVRGFWERLAIEYPNFRNNLPREGLQEEAMSQMAAVIMDGDILTLNSVIRDGAKVDVLTPLSGGANGGGLIHHRWLGSSMPAEMIFGSLAGSRLCP